MDKSESAPRRARERSEVLRTAIATSQSDTAVCKTAGQDVRLLSAHDVRRGALMLHDFKKMFPEFKSSLVKRHWQHIIAVSASLYGGSYQNPQDKVIILYLMAHLLQMRIQETENNSGEGADANVGRGVSSRSVGSVSESYFQTNSDSGGDPLATTAYGRTYLELISKNNGGCWV